MGERIAQRQRRAMRWRRRRWWGVLPNYGKTPFGPVGRSSGAARGTGCVASASANRRKLNYDTHARTHAHTATAATYTSHRQQKRRFNFVSCGPELDNAHNERATSVHPLRTGPADAARGEGRRRLCALEKWEKGKGWCPAEGTEWHVVDDGGRNARTMRGVARTAALLASSAKTLHRRARS